MPTEEISSDDDEVNEVNHKRNISQQPASSAGGLEDDDEEEEYWDEEGLEGTPLEEYNTPLDYDNGEDEYQFFTAALLSKMCTLELSSRCVWQVGKPCFVKGKCIFHWDILYN